MLLADGTHDKGEREKVYQAPDVTTVIRNNIFLRTEPSNVVKKGSFSFMIISISSKVLLYELFNQECMYVL